MFERLFDEHSDGNFVKTLLITMLLIATVVQPFSLIYTAYGDNLPHGWWDWMPALAALLFIALDWTILPLSYFFATTGKIGLKIVLTLMIGVVLFGAFEGYFTATERLIALRLSNITKQSLALEEAKEEVVGLTSRLNEMKRQNETDSVKLTKEREELMAQIAGLDALIAAKQHALAQAETDYGKIMERCLRIQDVCLKPERARHDQLTHDGNNQIDTWQKSKDKLNASLDVLRGKSDEKVVAANADLKAGTTRYNAMLQDFDTAVLGNQVYRWTGALLGVSPRLVTAEQANRMLDIFAAAVALSYVVAQALLAISYYGRHKPGFLQVTTPFWSASWRRILRSMRAYYARKRRGVYRDRVQEKQVIVPSGERVRIIYVPVPPGGPVPPPEEIVTRNPKVAH
jgi:hypothetical protein